RSTGICTTGRSSPAADGTGRSWTRCCCAAIRSTTSAGCCGPAWTSCPMMPTFSPRWTPSSPPARSRPTAPVTGCWCGRCPTCCGDSSRASRSIRPGAVGCWTCWADRRRRTPHRLTGTLGHEVEAVHLRQGHPGRAIDVLRIGPLPLGPAELELRPVDLHAQVERRGLRIDRHRQQGADAAAQPGLLTQLAQDGVLHGLPLLDPATGQHGVLATAAPAMHDQELPLAQDDGDGADPH